MDDIAVLLWLLVVPRIGRRVVTSFDVSDATLRLLIEAPRLGTLCRLLPLFQLFEAGIGANQEMLEVG